MRRILTVCAFAAALSTLALAETWTGRLVDATCAQQQKTMTGCDATSTTTQFALVVSGKTFMLDDAGNAKAMEALKSRADREANPNSATTKRAVAAKITGTKQADNTIKVEEIDVQ